MRNRLLLGGIVSAIALTLVPQPASASTSHDCDDIVCRAIETTKIFFCVRDLTCD